MKIDPIRYEQLNAMATQLLEGPRDEILIPSIEDQERLGHLTVQRGSYSLVAPHRTIQILAYAPGPETIGQETATILRFKRDNLTFVKQALGRSLVSEMTALLIPKQREALIDATLTGAEMAMQAVLNARDTIVLKD